MAWGNSGNVSTTNLSDGTKSPALARQDLYDALVELIAVIDGRNTANGVLGLDASTKVVASYLPNEFNSSSGQNLTLDPATDKVAIEHIINLNPQTAAQLNGRTDQATGDVAFCSDGGDDSAGVGCLAVWDGTDWRAVQLGSVL